MAGWLSGTRWAFTSGTSAVFRAGARAIPQRGAVAFVGSSRALSRILARALSAERGDALSIHVRLNYMINLVSPRMCIAESVEDFSLYTVDNGACRGCVLSRGEHWRVRAAEGPSSSPPPEGGAGVFSESAILAPFSV